MTKHHEWTTLAMRNSFKRAAGIYSGYKTHQQSLATALKYAGGCPELLPPVAEPVCAQTEGEGRGGEVRGSFRGNGSGLRGKCRESRD